VFAGVSRTGLVRAVGIPCAIGRYPRPFLRGRSVFPCATGRYPLAQGVCILCPRGRYSLRKGSVLWPPARQKCAASRLLATKTCVRGRYCGAPNSSITTRFAPAVGIVGLSGYAPVAAISLRPFCPPTSAPCMPPGGRNGPKLASEVGIEGLFLRQGSVFHAGVLATATHNLPANKTER